MKTIAERREMRRPVKPSKIVVSSDYVFLGGVTVNVPWLVVLLIILLWLLNGGLS